MNSDVLIIGGGVIGLAIAREIRNKGIEKVTVVDKGCAGAEASWAAAGILAPQAETDRIDEFFKICTASRDLYPEFAAELREESGVDIELDRNGTIYLAFDDGDVREIRKRFEWQTHAGLNVGRLTNAECCSLETNISSDVREALLFPDDWQVENRKLLAALIEYARRNGVEIVENSPITSLLTNGREVTGARSVDERTYSAGTVVLTTGAWTSLIKIGEEPVPVNVKPIRGQMICFKPAEKHFDHVIYSPRGYLVPRADGRILAGATVEDAGFEIETTDDAVRDLLKSTAEIAPGLAKLSVVDHWAGLRPFAVDGLPVIGKISQADNLFVATAHYRNGVLLAPITAKIMADAVVENRYSEFISPFGPQRFRVAGSTM
jgi:glycine oxidase